MAWRTETLLEDLRSVWASEVLDVSRVTIRLDQGRHDCYRMLASFEMGREAMDIQLPPARGAPRED